MKRILLLSIVALLFGRVEAQRIYVASYESQANVKVFVVKYECQADLKVYEVKY